MVLTHLGGVLVTRRRQDLRLLAKWLPTTAEAPQVSAKN